MEIAMKAAHAAGKVIREYSDNRNRINVDFKGKNDLVTNADVAAEKVILDIISGEFPGDRFLAEESSASADFTKERTWIIDPIDGTTNFAHGLPIYCVSIALWVEKKPKVGVILDVCRNEIFHAEEGKGAYLNGDPTSVSDIENPAESLVLTSFPSVHIEFLDEFLELFCVLMDQTQGPRRPGSAAYDLICIASGRCDGYYVYGLSPWDVAAGGLIIQEAGGLITDWKGSDNWLTGERLIAGNKVMHNFLSEKLKEYIPDQMMEI